MRTERSFAATVARVSGVVLVAVSLAVAPAIAAGTADRCATIGIGAALNLARGEAACRAVANRRGRAVDPACIARAESRFSAALAAAARAGCGGASEGSYVAEVERFLDALAGLASAVPTPTPAPTATPGACGTAHCCVGVGLSGAGCAFEAWDDGGMTSAELSCTSRGGTWQAGKCPDSCALPAGCCVLGNGCGVAGVFGSVDFGNLGIFCPLVGATGVLGRCPD